MKRLKFFWPYLTNKNPKIGKNEDTPLHFVAYHGLSDVADFMIEELQSVENLFPENNSCTTPLHNMCRGHAAIIRSLRRKIDFEFINQSLFQDILKEAINYGYLDCVKALVEKQTPYFQRKAVDIAKNYYSSNVLSMNQNHYKIVQYLSEEFTLTSNIKVNSFQNEDMKSSHCPKPERKSLKNSALSVQGRIFQIFRFFEQWVDSIFSL